MLSRFDEWVLKKVHEAAGDPPVRLALANGPEVRPKGRVQDSIIFRDRYVLARLMADPDIGFGEAYANGELHIEGDLMRIVSAAFESKMAAGKRNRLSRAADLWLRLTQRNTRRGSRHNIHRHYDIGNDFYKLWLDEQLVYTCAYFASPESGLEEAQLAKMDHVCRKVRLQPSERVVEAGCGWGALALHMARYYGVKVKAFNISREQIAYARWRAAKEGLDDRVEFIQDDYRNISGGFDVFMSVGMLEHVGKSHYSQFSKIVQRAIGDRGRGLLHFIGRNQPRPLNAWIRKRIFPGGYTPSLREVMGILESPNFSVLDVENLRMHYARTLEHWLERFENSVDEVRARFDERFVRTWRLYLAGSAAAFRAGSMQLFQVVFAGSKCEALPWTRAHLYEPQVEEDQSSMPAFG